MFAQDRQPAVAGAFYPANKSELLSTVKQLFANAAPPQSRGPIAAIIVPHAGYVYSGEVAASGFNQLDPTQEFENIFLVGSSHQIAFEGASIYTGGNFITPLGSVPVNTELGKKLIKESKVFSDRSDAHLREHSLEVQLPFLQYLFGSEFRIVPICFLMQDLNSSMEVGHAVAKVLAGKKAVVIASSDMTHYEPHKVAERKDRLALQSVEEMDEAKFYSTIEEHRISACGYGPIVALITAAKDLGAKEAKLLCYKTSGDVSGDYSAVVGYAAVEFTK